MPVISLAAEASAGIMRRIGEGSLKIDGIILRDAKGPFRYILRGFGNLPKNASQLSTLSALEPLRAAMTLQQILQVVSIAQNVEIAASLHRIERRLEDIENRLSGIEHRLTRVECNTNLLLEAVRSSPVNRLKGVKTAAVIAFSNSDQTALTGAAQAAEHAARDILDQSKHLVRVEEDGLPVALRMPQELADLVASAVDAFDVASAILVALKRRTWLPTCCKRSLLPSRECDNVWPPALMIRSECSDAARSMQRSIVCSWRLDESCATLCITAAGVRF